MSDPDAPPLSWTRPPSYAAAPTAPGVVAVLEEELGGLAGREVVVVSGSFGAGHDAAAAQIVARLAAAGARTRVLDVVEVFPVRTGRAVRWLYPRLLRWWPTGWTLLLALLAPGRRVHAAVTALVGGLGGRLVAAMGPADLVVSTHPFASQALGHERVAGRLAAPVVTYLTDASVHALWVHPGVDLHLALHAAARAQATDRLGPGARVRTVRPLVPAAYDEPRDPAVVAAFRRSLGVAPETALLLVVGGSLGVGRLRQTARDLRDTGCGTPVVVCGRNVRLRRRLEREPGVVAVGWRDDLPDLIRSADCVVQNAGGFTAWEALAAGTPVVTYRSISGHGETNAATLSSHGLVPWPRDRVALRAEVGAALTLPRQPGRAEPALPLAS